MRRSSMDQRLPTLAPLARRLLWRAGSVGRRLARTRLSLRMLIVFVLVVGCGFGWLVRSAREQREAVHVLMSASGGVDLVYDLEWRCATPNPYLSPWSPLHFYDGKPNEHPWLKWVVDRVGVDYFGNVVKLTLNRRPDNDAMMAHVGRLRRLQRLNLYGTWVTDDGLANLEGSTDLQELILSSTPVSDRGLAHLKGLTGLRTLHARCHSITADGIRDLKRCLPKLRVISDHPWWQ